MSITLTIRDESPAGDVILERPLEFPSETITLRELIRERVYQEVQDYNRNRAAQVFRGLVQPTDSERLLNGKTVEYRLKSAREVDWKPQFEKAIEAFEKNAFLVLVGNKEAFGLDEPFTINSQSSVSFIKLTMLVGG